MQYPGIATEHAVVHTICFLTATLSFGFGQIKEQTNQKRVWRNSHLDRTGLLQMVSCMKRYQRWCVCTKQHVQNH